MKERNPKFPREENLGKNCMYWDMGCGYPKFEMQGRISCEGIIDPVCIYLKDGRKVEGFDLTEEQITKLKTTLPGKPHSIPPGKPMSLKNQI